MLHNSNSYKSESFSLKSPIFWIFLSNLNTSRRREKKTDWIETDEIQFSLLNMRLYFLENYIWSARDVQELWVTLILQKLTQEIFTHQPSHSSNLQKNVLLIYIYKKKKTIQGKHWIFPGLLELLKIWGNTSETCWNLILTK